MVVLDYIVGSSWAKMTKLYTLHFTAYSPTTIPLSRLATYMQRVAELLGTQNAVHFEKLIEGSTGIVARVEHVDVPKVEDRLVRIRSEEAPSEAFKAFADIDKLLAEDNADGRLIEGEGTGAEILLFRGVTKVNHPVHGPFNQEGSLDGLLVSIGGADETVHLQLQGSSGKITGIETTRQLAKRLAHSIYEPIRLYGVGRWLRDQNGVWVMKRFRADRFETLKETGLDQALSDLREAYSESLVEADSLDLDVRFLRDSTGDLH